MKNDGGKRRSGVKYEQCSPGSASRGAAEGFPQSAINQISCRRPSAAAANDGDIDFIYLHKSIASGQVRGRGAGVAAKSRRLSSEKRGGREKVLFLASSCV